MTDRFTGQAQFQVEWSLFLANPPPPTSTRQAGLYLQWADARMLKTALAIVGCVTAAQPYYFRQLVLVLTMHIPRWLLLHGGEEERAQDRGRVRHSNICS